jgi:hypothetical protein
MKREILLVLCMIPVFLPAQLRLGAWKNFTDMKSVRAMDVHGTTVWVATGGGAFSMDTLTGMIRQYNNTNGITSNDLTALAVSQDGSVWVGAQDGSIDVLDPASDSWTAISNIRESTKLNKTINAFAMSGDTVFIVAGYGISVFKRSRWEFGDTYSGFGFDGQPDASSIAIDGSQIWVATSAGGAVGNRNDPSLTSPTAWTRYTMFGGISPALNTVTASSYGVLVGSGTGAALFNGSTFDALPLYAGRSVVSIFRVQEKLAVLSVTPSEGRVDMLNDPTQSPVNSWNVQGFVPRRIAFSANGHSFWVGTSSKGIGVYTGAGWNLIAPDGPQSNQSASELVRMG